MVINKKTTGQTKSIPAGLALGAVASLIVTLLIAVLMAILLDQEIIAWSRIGYGIMVLIFASSFTGAIVAVNSIRRQRLLVSLLSGFVYFGILLSITALFFGGQYEAVGVTAVLILGGCGTAGILNSGEKGRGKQRKNRKAYR